MNFTGHELNTLIKAQSKFTVKKSVRELYDIYKDNWAYMIRNELLYQFTEKTANIDRVSVTKEFNLLKRVINEISLIYKNPAIRKAIIQDEIKEKGEVIQPLVEDENYRAMIDATDIHTVMKEVNRYTNLTNNVMVKSVYRAGKMCFDILLFDNVEILTAPEDWRKIIAIKYYVGLNLPNYVNFTQDDNPTELRNDAMLIENRNEIYDYEPFERYNRSILYTIEDYKEGDNIYQKGYIYTYQQAIGKKNYDEQLISKEENPYRDSKGNVILPFVLFTKKFPIYQLLDYTSGNDLVDANIFLALNMVHLNELIKYQSYKQIYMIVNDKSSIPEKMKLGVKDIVVIKAKEGSGNIGTLDIQSNITQLWNTIKERITLVLSNYGISPQNFTMSGQPSSGYALQLDNRALLEARQDELPRYRNFEADLFEVMRSIWNYHNPDKLINVNAKFDIDFGDIEFPESISEKTQSMNSLIMNNIKTPIDYIKEENPDLSDEEAIRVFEKNKMFNAKQRIEVKPLEIPKGGNNAFKKGEK